MKTFEQRKYLNAILAFVVTKYFSSEAAAGLIHTFTKDNDVLKEHLVSSLTRSTIPTLDDSLFARRSVMAALAKDEGQSERVNFLYL
jgi:telomere length regulation protein